MSGGVKQGVLVALESHQLLSGGANNQACIHSCLRCDVSTPHQELTNKFAVKPLVLSRRLTHDLSA